MRKNDGFIATSLLYTFFLVFCALLMNLIASYMHTRVLLNNMTQTMKTELSKVGDRSLGCVAIDPETKKCLPVSRGAYIKMPINETIISSETSHTRWIVMSDLAPDSSDPVKMISEQTFLLSGEYYYQDRINERLNYFETGLRVSIKAPTLSDIDSMSSVTNWPIKRALLGAISVENHPSHTANTPGSFIYYETSGKAILYKYTCLLSLTNSCQASARYEVPNNPSIQYSIRAVLTLYSNRKIISGGGTLGNPYILGA